MSIVNCFKGTKLQKLFNENLKSNTEEVAAIRAIEDYYNTFNNKLNILKGKKDNSNFTYNNQQFNSIEQAFQAEKAEYASDTASNIKIWEDILLSSDISKIKELGNKFTGLNEYWKEDSSKIKKRLIKAYSQQTSNLFSIDTKDITKKEVIETEKNLPLQQQSKEAVQNLLLEAYRGVLLSPYMYNALMSPLDNLTIEDDIKSLLPKDTKEDDLLLFDPVNQLNIKFNFLGGKVGVGQTSNFIVDNAYSQHFNLLMKNVSIFNTNGNIKEKEIKLDQQYSRTLSNEELQFYKKINPDSIIDDIRKIEIFNAISMYVNGFVDTANKQGFISRGNWNIHTTGTGLSLIRAGMHPFRVNALLQQPIIKEYVKGLYRSFTLSTSIFEEVKTSALNKFPLSVAQKEENTNNIFSDLSLITLTNNIKEVNKKENYNLQQQLLLRDFLKFQTQLTPINNAIKGGKFDVEGLGGNLTTPVIFNNYLTKELNKGTSLKRPNISNLLDKYYNKDTGKLTMLGHKYYNSIKLLEDISPANPKFFLLANDKVIEAYNYSSMGLKGTKLLDPLLATKLENSMYSYIMSGFNPFSYISDEQKTLVYDEVFKNTWKDIVAYKKEDDTNKFVNSLIKNRAKGLTFITVNDSRSDEDFTNRMYSGWKDLLKTNEALATKLSIFSFIQSGFTNNYNEIYSFLPNEWLNKNNINGYINYLSTNMLIEPSVFLDQFVRHNWRNSNIVKSVPANKIRLIKKGKKTVPSYIGFKLVGSKYSINQAYNPEVEEMTFVYPAYIVKKGTTDIYSSNPVVDDLYKLKGYSRKGAGMYIRVNKLGFKGKKSNLIEYSYHTNVKKSYIDNNNVHDNNQILADNVLPYFSITEYMEELNIYNDIKNEGLMDFIGKPNPDNLTFSNNTNKDKLTKIEDILDCKF